jgi:glycosyltransferase involved in cell wall biosynthesis
MKVGITTHGVDIQGTGIGNYTRSLIHSLLGIKGIYDIEIYTIHYERSRDSLYRYTKEIMTTPLPIPPRKALTNLSKLPQQLKKEGIDLVHITAPNPSDNLSIPSLKGFKKVLTIHDLGLVLSPIRPNIYPLLGLWFYSRIWGPTLKLIINKIDMIIADSRNTKKDAIKYLKISGKKVRVIYLATAERFRVIEDTKKAYIGPPFILHDNSIQPNLISAYWKLKKRGIKHKLFVFGGMDQYTRRGLVDLIKKLDLRRDVTLLGYVSDEALVRLYNLADLFIFPSGRYEGFGLPPLEAMACGCPVITGNVGTMPEVVGDAGSMVNPDNVDEWVTAMHEVLTNEGLRQDLIKIGLERTKMFSWEKTAKETYKVYEEVCAQ